MRAIQVFRQLLIRGAGQPTSPRLRQLVLYNLSNGVVTNQGHVHLEIHWLPILHRSKLAGVTFTMCGPQEAVVLSLDFRAPKTRTGATSKEGELDSAMLRESVSSRTQE